MGIKIHFLNATLRKIFRGCYAKHDIRHMSMSPPANHVAGMLLSFSPEEKFEPPRDPDFYSCINSNRESNNLDSLNFNKIKIF